MASLTVLQARLDKLRSIRAKGVREFEIMSGNGSMRRISYSSDADIAAAIQDLERQIASMSSGGRVNSVVFRTTKGL
jgi:hypothetical protein